MAYNDRDNIHNRYHRLPEGPAQTRRPADMDLIIDANEPDPPAREVRHPATSHTHKPRKSHTAVIIIFTVIFTIVIVGCLYLLVFSNRGVFWSGNDPTRSLAPGTAPTVAYPFVGLSLENTTLTMNQGERYTLKAHFEKPAQSADVNTRSLKVVWKSENPAVCFVDQRGTVTARQPGTARIVVAIDNEDIDSNAAYCLITVNASDRYDGYEPSPTPSTSCDEYESTAPTTPARTEETQPQSSSAGSADEDDASVPVMPHRTNDYAAGKRSVFGGRGDFDHMSNTIVMTGTMTFTSHDSENRSITLHPGDRIRNAVVSRDGYLIQGQFHTGGRTVFLYALHEKL